MFSLFAASLVVVTVGGVQLRPYERVPSTGAQFDRRMVSGNMGLPAHPPLLRLAQGGSVLYVDALAADEPHDGSSWCQAFLTLHEALQAAATGTTIRVAAGTYYPNTGGLDEPRRATFQLKNGVTIEGGYAGCWGDDPDFRHLTLFETILSGDLNRDDKPLTSASICCEAHAAPGCDEPACGIEICAARPECCTETWDLLCADLAAVAHSCSSCATEGNVEDNAFHVISGSGTDPTAVLDGVTITAGHAADGEDFESLARSLVGP